MKTNKNKKDNVLHKGYKLRLYPSEEQKQFFEQNFGNARLLWNIMLSDKKEHYKETGKMFYKKLTEYKKEIEFLKLSDSLALCNVERELNKAYNNYFTNRKHFGLPKFKSKKTDKFSYTTNNQHTDGKNSICIKDNKIYLPKIGLVKVVKDREFVKDSIIKTVTISRTRTNKYYVSIIVEYEDKVEPIKEPKTYIGLDYSSPYMYVDSNGDSPNVPDYSRYESKIAREQRKLSRMEKGSNNYNKQKIKIAKIHEKVANIRKDFLHKTSRGKVNSYDVICVEDLDLKEIAKRNKETGQGIFRLGKATYNNGWGMFVNMLEYKMYEAGKHLVKANKWFPSTKQCSSCGKKREIEISNRVYECEFCGLEIDRDLNAALNLEQYGIDKFATT